MKAKSQISLYTIQIITPVTRKKIENSNSLYKTTDFCFQSRQTDCRNEAESPLPWQLHPDIITFSASFQHYVGYLLETIKRL